MTKREDADFMLGTCHKGKGQEEMYAQVRVMQQLLQLHLVNHPHSFAVASTAARTADLNRVRS